MRVDERRQKLPREVVELEGGDPAPLVCAGEASPGSTASRCGVLSTREMWTYWSTSRGETQE